MYGFCRDVFYAVLRAPRGQSSDFVFYMLKIINTNLCIGINSVNISIDVVLVMSACLMADWMSLIIGWNVFWWCPIFALVAWESKCRLPFPPVQLACSLPSSYQYSHFLNIHIWSHLHSVLQPSKLVYNKFHFLISKVANLLFPLCFTDSKSTIISHEQ